MGKQSSITQELANSFPEWTKIRTDPDSNGQRLLNCVANEIEDLENALIKVDKNIHLSTFNLDEIDQLFRIDLSSDFSFQEKNTYNNTDSYILPTSVIGILSDSLVFSLEDATNIYNSSPNTSNNIGVSIIKDGSVKSFWEDTNPDSLSKINTVTFGKTVLLHFDGSSAESASEGVVSTVDSGTINHAPTTTGPLGRTGKFVTITGNAANYITISSTSDTLTWAGSFTLDFWIKLDSASSDSTIVSGTQFRLDRIGSSNKWNLVQDSLGATVAFADSTPLTADTWYHIALTRDSGGVYRLFQDGVSLSMTGINPLGSVETLTNTTVVISGDPNSLGTQNIHLDEFRIVKNKAHWTRNFITPKSQYNVLPLVKTIRSLETVSSLDHPLKSIRGGGKFYLRLNAKYPYFRQDSNNKILRCRVLISGITRKGLKDSEVVVFPWESIISTRKEWATINSLVPLDIPEDIDTSTESTLTIYGDNSLQEDFLSLTNFRWSKKRKKIDEFWGVLTVDGKSLLDRAEYATDNWRMLIKGYTGKVSKDRWHLQDKDGTNLTGILDIEFIPFQNKIWAIDSTHLFLYDLDKENNVNIDRLKNPLHSPNIEIVLDMEDVVISESLTFSLYHKRTMQSIEEYKVWYEIPGNTTKNYLTGTSSTYTINNTNKRIVYSGTLEILTDGEYILGATALYADGTTESTVKLINVKSKKPLKSFLLSSLGITNPTGLFLDSDQKLWIKTDLAFNEIKKHKNIALFDYNRKIIYLHENYTSLTVDYA